MPQVLISTDTDVNRGSAAARRLFRRLGRARGELGGGHLAVAVLVPGTKAVRGRHRPFLECQQVVVVEIELLERLGAGREQFLARDDPVAVAVEAAEPTL